MAVLDNADKFILGESWLGDLGFISHIRDKSVFGTHYFLRSSSKVLKDTVSSEGVKIFSGTLSSVIPGDSFEVPDRSNDLGALRAVDSLNRGSL